jgi:hypothetical protein
VTDTAYSFYTPFSGSESVEKQAATITQHLESLSDSAMIQLLHYLLMHTPLPKNPDVMKRVIKGIPWTAKLVLNAANFFREFILCTSPVSMLMKQAPRTLPLCSPGLIRLLQKYCQ